MRLLILLMLLASAPFSYAKAFDGATLDLNEGTIDYLDDVTPPDINEGAIGHRDDATKPDINEGAIGHRDDITTPDINEGATAFGRRLDRLLGE